MDFKALSRTAEADVLAFASAAPRRLVQSRMVSVGLTANHRFCAAHFGARAVSSGKSIAGETIRQLNGGKVFQPGQIFLEGLVSRILEGVEGLCPPIVRRECAEESSVESELLVGSSVKKKGPSRCTPGQCSNREPKQPVPLDVVPHGVPCGSRASTTAPIPCHPPCRW